MSWSDLYLFCFLFGLSLSALSFLAGLTHFHLPIKTHLPFHAHGHHGGGGALRVGAKGSMHISWFNASTALAFLAWFGGTGYILTKYSHLFAYMSLAISTASGFFAGFLVFRFMAKIVQTTEAQLYDWDFRMEGAVGTVSSPIRQCGVGEILFEQNGSRKSVAARSANGSEISTGEEVVVERYDGGIAYVRRWSEFTK